MKGGLVQDMFLGNENCRILSNTPENMSCFAEWMSEYCLIAYGYFD